MLALPRSVPDGCFQWLYKDDERVLRLKKRHQSHSPFHWNNPYVLPPLPERPRRCN
jgi:hypothetical protein